MIAIRTSDYRKPYVRAKDWPKGRTSSGLGGRPSRRLEDYTPEQLAERERLAASVAAMAEKLARIARSRIPAEYVDIKAHANMGIVRALNEWESVRSTKCKFSTYAWTCIQSELGRFEAALKTKKRRPAKGVAGDGGGFLCQSVATDTTGPFAEACHREEVARLRKAVSRLRGRQKDVIRTMLGWNGKPPCNPTEGARTLGISYRRFHELHQEAMANLREAMGA